MASDRLRKAIEEARAKYGGIGRLDGVNSIRSRHRNDGSDECPSCMTLHPCDAAILIGIIDAALASPAPAPGAERLREAAQAFSNGFARYRATSAAYGVWDEPDEVLWNQFAPVRAALAAAGGGEAGE